MNLDALLDRTWSKNYTCNEFACEAWQKVTGEDLQQKMLKHFNSKPQFQLLDKPISPCLIFFSNNVQTTSHVGVFYNDKLLHLCQKGVQYIPLELVAMNFRTVRFYR